MRRLIVLTILAFSFSCTYQSNVEKPTVPVTEVAPIRVSEWACKLTQEEPETLTLLMFHRGVLMGSYQLGGTWGPVKEYKATIDDVITDWGREFVLVRVSRGNTG